MSNQSLSERVAIKLNELGLTEIKAKHIPFLAIILLIIVLVILYFTVKQVKKGILTLFTTIVNGITSLTGISRPTIKMIIVLACIAAPILYYYFVLTEPAEHFGSTPAAIIQLNARDAQDGYAVGGIQKNKGCYVRPTQRGTPLEKCQEKNGRNPPN
jgi:hypothetical protein